MTAAGFEDGMPFLAFSNNVKAMKGPAGPDCKPPLIVNIQSSCC